MGWPLEQLFWFPGGSLKDSRLSHQLCEVSFTSCFLLIL
jgi:hypothetical protein